MNKNRLRKHDIHLRLNDKEYTLLEERRAKCALSQQTYLRKLVVDDPPLETPSADFFQFYYALQATSVNINQIALEAHSKGFINAPAFWEECKNIEKMINELFCVMILPKWMDERIEDVMRRRYETASKHKAERNELNQDRNLEYGREEPNDRKR